MLIISHPDNCSPERTYIFDVLLTDFLGIEYVAKPSSATKVEITFNNRTLTLRDDFFQIAKGAWLKKESLPIQPLEKWDSSSIASYIKLMDKDVPVIFGKPLVKLGKKECHIGIDIFGSCFFMLARYEEVVKADRDNHDRFPSKASLAFQEGFLDRPIVNEYLEILWACIHHLWPNIPRKQRSFQMHVTADMDRPYGSSVQTPVRLLRQIGGDLLVRESPGQAVRSLISGFKIRTNDFSHDQKYSLFSWMMDVNEKANNTMVFYLMAGISSHKADGSYSLDEPVIRKLLKQISSRGHEIGLHPSYETYQNLSLISQEVQALQRVLDEEKIDQEHLGSRQHYLRWKTPITPRNLASAGIQYDSTLSFADHAGFRSGTL